MEFFLGNPFSTLVGQRIDYATRSSLQSEDWGINMEICDIINETEEGPKDAVRAIKKRIVGNRNFKEVMLALTVLEACVKNCGHKFHVLVSSKEFVEGVLVKTILPKNEPPMVIHNKVLSIIQAWANAFRSTPDLTGVVCVYEELRRKGVEFPLTELHSPIHTPNRGPDSACEAPFSPAHQALPPQQISSVQNAQGSTALSSQQTNKIRSNLEQVQSNLKLMSDIMKQVDPKCVKQSDVELLKQLYSVCKEKQNQMVELIPRVGDEQLVEQLLAVNDDMNGTFTQYHRIENLLNRQTTRQSSQGDLIDLTPSSETQNQSKQAAPIHQTVNSLSSQMAGLNTKMDKDTQRKQYSSEGLPERNGQENTVLDELAAGSTQVLNTGSDDIPDSIPLGSSPQFHWMVEKGMIPLNQDDTMDNIEQWLNESDDEDLINEGVTTEAFDKFLAGRVKAAEHLPPVKESSGDNAHSEQ